MTFRQIPRLNSSDSLSIYLFIYLFIYFIRSHWVVLPETVVPGRPIPLTFNFYNTTKDVKVKVDLIKDSHHLVSTTNHTFLNGMYLTVLVHWCFII